MFMLGTMPLSKNTVDAASSGEVDVDLYEQPGHLIRRAQQIAVARFSQHLGTEVTPIQYAILRMVHERPGIDQVGLSKYVALDTSTAALTAARLESKGLLTRSVVLDNRRQLQLHLTPEGERMLEGWVTGVHKMREDLLHVLEPEEREQFMLLLRKFVQLNNNQSRAPLHVAVRPAPGRTAASAEATRPVAEAKRKRT